MEACNLVIKLERKCSTPCPILALYPKIILADQAFMLAAPILRNNLPADLRNCTTNELFKSKLKRHFFNITFKEEYFTSFNTF